MKEIIDYLTELGFEDADSNFLFLQYLITCKEYEKQCGLDKAEWLNIKKMILTNIIE